ncbi:MAG: hypothetical protein D6722_07000 [Bacteroidetes bacterium]|nr:MAG: hypothetical protein D6722_07000 [Bacteroidota bacterium]
MKKGFLLTGLILLIILLVGLVRVNRHLSDRFPGYELVLDRQTPTAGALRAGFAQRSITPAVPDSWEDVDDNAVYDPSAGDRFLDQNENGEFDPVWIAGFQSRRPAQGVHDSLWARVMVIDDGHTRLAIAAIDAIGFGHDDVLRVRAALPDSAGIDYATIVSTHTHQAPDLIGLWGPGTLTSGVDPDYQAWVIEQTAAAIAAASAALRPARLRLAQDPDGATPLVGDTRDPQVLDPGLRLIQAIDPTNDSTLGTLIAWANHPETVWNKNLWLSSDFPHYLREGVEKGLYRGDSLVRPGLGGIALYVNGAIGGLMTTHPDMPVADPWRDTSYLAPSFAKAEAQGVTLARLSLDALAASETVLDSGAIRLQARTIDLPLANPLFRAGAALGVLNRGTPRWMHLRSEVAYWTLGPMSVLQVPGEIYPEIVNGGIEAPEGQDFAVDPEEIPPLRELMAGDYRLVLGLANDLIGYIIPRSEWDAEPPYLYGAESAHYGEINSLGPETAPRLYQALRALLPVPDSLAAQR